MNTYKSLFQSFLKETICSYRCKNSYSQEYMAELLHITPRAYIDKIEVYPGVLRNECIKLFDLCYA